jgi:hypothetical protein
MRVTAYFDIQLNALLRLGFSFMDVGFDADCFLLEASFVALDFGLGGAYHFKFFISSAHLFHLGMIALIGIFLVEDLIPSLAKQHIQERFIHSFGLPFDMYCVAVKRLL